MKANQPSAADEIALAATIAIEEWYATLSFRWYRRLEVLMKSPLPSGGPKLDFRGGRVDATKADIPGVPKPEEGIDAHTAAFARQGFSPTEMIGLVACGHTFGGVQHDSFPQIVPDSDDPVNNNEGNVAFDSTGVHFDTNVYVSELPSLVTVG